MFKYIEHPLSVHTFLPSDHDFSKIEKFQKIYPISYTPEQWRDIVGKCGKKVSTQMNIEDMVDLNDLKRIFNIKDDFGDNPMFSKAVCFKLYRQTNDNDDKAST